MHDVAVKQPWTKVAGWALPEMPPLITDILIRHAHGPHALLAEGHHLLQVGPVRLAKAVQLCRCRLRQFLASD